LVLEGAELKDGEKVKDTYVDQVATALEKAGELSLKRVLLDVPLESVMTDTSTSDLRIRPFAYPLMAQVIEMLCLCEKKEEVNKMKMALQHNTMIHSPLIALQSSGQILRLNARIAVEDSSTRYPPLSLPWW